MLSVDLQTNKPPKTYSTSLNVRYVQRCKSSNDEPKDQSTTIRCADFSQTNETVAIQPETTPKVIAPPEDIVARIIADFDECDSTTEVLPFYKSAASKQFEELVINTTSSIVPVSGSVLQKSRFAPQRRLIPSSSLSVTQPVPSKTDVAAASRAYEFSEETEKYEKISSFRKRRLADKKYEFSEDNSENIIPFAKLRMRRQTRLLGSPTMSNDSGLSAQTTQHTHRASPSHGFRSPCGSPVGNRFIIMSPPSGVRGVGLSQLYGRSPTYKPFSSSPRHIVHTKRTSAFGGYHFDVNDFISNGSIYSPLLLSPRSDADFEVFRHSSTSTSASQPLTEVKPSNISTDPISLVNNSQSFVDKATDTKPVCAKKLVRHYVEEDDTTSVITSEEDDCISPGYHTSLPVEVHGACYSGMQLVSAASYQQRLLRGTTAAMNPAVLVTQHTFDLETLTYHIANRLCVMHNKQYGFFYDWACEPVHVSFVPPLTFDLNPYRNNKIDNYLQICPLSAILTCILIVNFTARDATAPGAAPCLNCTNREQLDCAFHRRHFECRSIFTWNVQSGDWTILDYGELAELSPSVLRKRNATGNGGGGASSTGTGTGGDGAGITGSASELTRIVRKMARELAPSMRTDEPTDWAGLWTLDSCVDRSKESLRDQHNSIEFYRGPVGQVEDEDDDNDNRRTLFGRDADDSSDSSDSG